MTREEWYASPKFLKLRLINHLAHGMVQASQQLADLLAVVDAEHGPLAGDKFNLAERQLRVVHLEARNLTQATDALTCTLQPPAFDPPPPKPPQEPS